MSPESFNKLVELLAPKLLPKNLLMTRKDFLPPRTIVAIALRYFAGGSYLDLIRRSGISKQGIYSCVHRVVKAVNSTSEVGHVEFPTTLDECHAFAAEWAELSGPSGDRGLFNTAIGMLDGILVRIKAPSIPRAEDYRSGHKKAYGVNVQACCDARLRIMFLSCKTPGKTNDLKAYRKSDLSRLIESLPEGFWVGGDNAYVNSEHMLVPFPGADNVPRNDTFNYYLSQLRIRVEMTFGVMVARWGVLWSPLRISLKRVPALVLCLAKLHNFCIDMKDAQPPVCAPSGIERPDAARLRMESRHGKRVLRGRATHFRTEYTLQRSVMGSDLRDQLADYILEKNYRRPLHNRVRNAGR